MTHRISSNNAGGEAHPPQPVEVARRCRPAVHRVRTRTACSARVRVRYFWGKDSWYFLHLAYLLSALCTGVWWNQQRCKVYIIPHFLQNLPNASIILVKWRSKGVEVNQFVRYARDAHYAERSNSFWLLKKCWWFVVRRRTCLLNELACWLVI